MQNIKTVIDSGWEFAERLSPERDFFLPQGGEKLWLSAQVPGHVHLDLMRHGVIGDPFYRINERGCAWVDEADWTYRTTFLVDAERIAARGEHGRHFLHFHGLDTICRVFLNGVLIGSPENFFIPHRFDVTETLREGANELRIEFDSALRVGRERAEAYLGDGTSTRGRMGYFNFSPRAFVRKPQYSFGWDWGPELISCGIWQKVELETVPIADIVDWTYDYEFTDASTVQATIVVEVDRYDDEADLELNIELLHRFTRRGVNKRGEVSLLASASEIRPPFRQKAPVPNEQGRITVKTDFLMEEMSEWSPNGSNNENSISHLLSIQLRGDNNRLSHIDATIGFRRIELIQKPDTDGKGEGMMFRINGVDTFIKGANWIPDHSFPSMITRERLKQRLYQAKDAGFNMLRVWGGGLYESEDFYRLCDHLGILVWQDFPFACSSYPDDLPEFREQVRQEAIAAVRRIRNHPCLALWCGGNENLELFQGRWDKEKQATEFFGDRLIHDILPTVLAAEDPKTPYLPNSPYGGENATSEDYGDSHYWNVWHAKFPGSTGDWTNYALSRTRFSSEFGFAAPAGMAAWDSCMTPDDKDVHSPVSIWHDKTRKGYETYLNYIAMHYPAPQTFEDLVYYGQCNQADALKFGVEHWRRLKGRCWGTLFWQFNDCWPTHSWAVVDSAGDPRAAYYAAKRFYAPLLLSLYRNGEQVEAHLVNDTLDMIPGHLTLRLLSFDGDELEKRETDATTPANAASGCALTLLAPANWDAFVHATFHAPDGTPLAENFQLLAEPKELRPPDPLITMRVTAAGNGEATLTISAQRFARYVWLRFDDLSTLPRFSDNFFTLAPYQSRAIALDNLPSEMTAEQIRARLRLRWH